ncbi:Nlrc3, partial [Symbiodinium necroappetens]
YHGDGRTLFARLCRALPELPKLRVLDLELDGHGSIDKARVLAAGLGQQKELERLKLSLYRNSLGPGLSCAPRSLFDFQLVGGRPPLGVGPASRPHPCIHLRSYQLLGIQ